MSKLLPCHYFMMTFTVPEQLRRVIRSNQKVCYEALFKSSSDAIKKLAGDERFVGTKKVGMTGVLHTWGSKLQYHPHIHYMVPGGGISADTAEWKPARQDLFVHVRPLSEIFKAKFRDAMKNAGLYSQIDSSVWEKNWCVHSQAVGDGQNTMGYMARYLFRVAISNARIMHITGEKVTFRYKAEEFEERQWKTMTLEVFEFIRRFLQHVLPTGFMKVRRYGFLNASFSMSLEKIRSFVCKCLNVLCDVVSLLVSCTPRGPKCPRCKSKMTLIRFFRPIRQGAPSG